jgi:hypothetical protein
VDDEEGRRRVKRMKTRLKAGLPIKVTNHNNTKGQARNKKGDFLGKIL